MSDRMELNEEEEVPVWAKAAGDGKKKAKAEAKKAKKEAKSKATAVVGDENIETASAMFENLKGKDWLLQDRTRAWPYIGYTFTLLIAMLCIALTKVECEVDIGNINYKDIDGGDFAFNTVLAMFLLGLLLIALYFFIGREKLKSVRIGGPVNWQYLEFWLLSLGTAFLFIGAVIFGFGLQKNQQKSKDDDSKCEKYGGLVFGMVCALLISLAYIFPIYIVYQELRVKGYFDWCCWNDGCKQPEERTDRVDSASKYDLEKEKQEASVI